LFIYVIVPEIKTNTSRMNINIKYIT